MKAVGIKQLKAHLSSYIRLAKAGETVLVTEREEVVAELRPARRRLSRASAVADIEDVLDTLAEEGEIERASVPKNAKWRWRVDGAGLSPVAVSAILEAVREER
jgi:antitoxin (DNA-binding transcriptional repressor) of toxin-antitoxin stability system